MAKCVRWLGWIALLTVAGCVLAAGGSPARTAEQQGGEPVVIRDVLWVWGNPEMTQPGEQSLETFAEASPARRAALLGVPNIVMAGLGLPNDQAEADRLTAEVSHAPRLTWEISADGEGGPPFVYKQRVTQVSRLVAKYPQIGSVLLDDMSTVQISKGLKAEDVRELRRLLREQCPGVKLAGAVYTMSLDDEGLAHYIRELDTIVLATWHARDVVGLERNVARCEREYPGREIVLCLYMYDYGEGRRMPREWLQEQCETALRLVHERRVQGIIFLTINDDPESVGWVADWVRRVGAQRIGEPGAGTARTGDPPLTIGDGKDWHCLPAPWTEDAQGVIRPPDRRNLHSRAFCTSASLADGTVEFEFNGDYRETGTGMAGLILRAGDPNHFYYVYFPWGGQQLRAKHFWAAVAKVDGDAYLRNLGAAWVPGVPSETGRWYRVRVAVDGPRIRVWVDGRHALEVTDSSYSAGRLGLAGYGWYAFRNVRYEGQGSSVATWDRSPGIPTHTFTVGLSSEEMPTGCMAPNGDVLLAAGSRLVRSADRGRSWSEAAALPESLGKLTDYGSTMFRTRRGRLIVMVCRTQEQVGKPEPEILIAESKDNGATWSDPVASQVAPGWPAAPANLVPYGPLVETADGTLLRFLLGGVKEEGDRFTDVRTWGAIHCKAFCIRSTDGGAGWSAPTDLDQPSWVGAARGSIPGSLDLTEPTGVALDNALCVLVRPVYSPYMWQCWSPDGGLSWDAAARATFPGYAQSMVRTSSGAILCAHRYPGYSVNVSRDGGLNWDAGTVIDYPAWAMGCMIEVAPEVVLCTYMNAERNLPLLAQLIRVTPDRLEPAIAP